jgi:hypothetical protein
MLTLPEFKKYYEYVVNSLVTLFLNILLHNSGLIIKQRNCI